ncbi:MAG: hypothetical protein J6P81_02455, partial [Spirochaetales bacterium]|nr:hypothetical protein [Spirochaetales bacterium]
EKPAEEKPQEIKEEPKPEPEVATQPEPQPEPVSQPEPEPEVPTPAAPQPQEPSEWTLETLSDVLPHGTVGLEHNDMGLVLFFNSRLFFQTANRNADAVREKIHQKTGSDVNIIFSFSETKEAPSQAPAEDNPEEEKPAEEKPQEIKEEPKPEPVKESSLSEEQKNLITDLMLCFDGREER